MATAIEYGLISALISVAAITAFTTVGTKQPPQYKQPDTVTIERFGPAHRQPTDPNRKAYCLELRHTGMSMGEETKAVLKTVKEKPELKDHVAISAVRGTGTAYNGCVQGTYVIIYRKKSWWDSWF